MAEQVSTHYGFHLELVDEQGQLVHDQRLRSSAFEHALRWTLFDAWRSGKHDAYPEPPVAAELEPRFPADDGDAPWAEGFTVTIALRDDRVHAYEFGTTYFATLAGRLRAALVRNNAMTSEQVMRYRVAAFLDEAAAVLPGSHLPISVEVVSSGLRLSPVGRDSLGTSHPWDHPRTTDLPVLVDRVVVEDVVDEARAAPDREIAGFLFGHLHRDSESREVFLVVTGLASAADTVQSGGTSVTYTPESFTRARDMLRLRAANEFICGWYHSHPFLLCAECPLPTPPECLAKVLSYSDDDLHLMETTFEQPYMVGLLATIDPRIETTLGHLPIKLFGWRDGEVQPRGFDVLEIGAV